MNIHKQINVFSKIQLWKRLLIIAGISCSVSGLIMYFVYLPTHKLNETKTEELYNLNKKLKEQIVIANNLPIVQKAYNQLEIELNQALEELPNSKEIPDLLTSISDIGKKTGLEFLIFKPKNEIPKDFYAEVPVDIVVSGSFYSLINFFYSISNMSRIVNISNVDVSDIKNNNNRAIMKITCLATTFRFLEKKEIKDEKNNKK